jgi:tRNA(Arg) A34 adenosine deaminase TadA
VTTRHGFAAGLASAPELIRRIFELAWDSYREGSVPVGTVITDQTSGSIIASGRNRTRDLRPDRRGVNGTDLAHAEIVALHDLGSGRTGIDVTSTLEPCAMCAGALLVYRVAALRYLAPDPFFGVGVFDGLAARFPEEGRTPYPAGDPGLDLLAGALVTEHMLRSGRHAAALTAWQSSAPGHRLGTKLFSRGRLDDLARSGGSVVDVADVADRVWPGA